MKKSVLRVRNLNMQFNPTVTLRDISFDIPEGECVAFLGLANSGKDVVLQIISGNAWISHGKIAVDERVVVSAEELREKAFVIQDINYAIEGWTVAEYIGLTNKKFAPRLFLNKTLAEETRALFSDLAIEIDPEVKLGSLSELKKRTVDLAKAYLLGKKIIIIRDEFEGCTTEDIVQFKKNMTRLLNTGLVAIVDCHSENVVTILADSYVVFREGRIAKKVRDFDDTVSRVTDMFLPNETFAGGKASKAAGEDIVYALRGVELSNKTRLDFDFPRGSVTSLVTLNREDKSDLFGLLSGREIHRETVFFLDGKRCAFSSLHDFVNSRIVSASRIGKIDELFPYMSSGENMLLPSIKKVSFLDYVFSGSRMPRSVVNQSSWERETQEDADLLENDTNGLIRVALERWRIMRPKVIVLLEPFMFCDTQGVSIIKRYVKEYTQNGASVIIIKSRKENAEEISDTILNLDAVGMK